MSRRPTRLIAVVLALLVGYTPLSHAYHDRTHNAINVGAARASSLDVRLQNDLSFENGTNQIIMGKRVIDWIGQAGALEDVPVTRTRNHFHRPLRSLWRNAGLNDGLLSGTSSILWGQDANQGFSWVNARKAYINALIAASATERQKWFAETFRAIGQVMHLIADSSVPAHVRNDQHTGGDPYEEWVELQAELQSEEKPDEATERFLGSFAQSPLRPDRSILDIPILGQDALDAPVPIARIWDTDRYDGTNPAITSQLGIGIAEYSNANFFSDDTVFANRLEASHRHFSPFPSTGDVEEWVDLSNNRKYWRKRADAPGEPVQHLATVSIRSFWSRSSGVAQEIRGGLNDDKVHEEYARLLIPRAVGYSAGLLDYFFRGTLDFTIGGSPPNQTLTITNKSDEAMEGTFTLYADNFSDTRRAVAGASFNLNLGPGATSSALSFTPPAEVQAYTLVFQGKLGLEEGAVTGKVNDWYAVTDVTPKTIAPAQATTLTVTVKSNFSREPRTLTAALFNARAGKLASTSVVIANSGPAITKITLEIPAGTISTSNEHTPRPVSLVVATSDDIGGITAADLNTQASVGTNINVFRVGQSSRLPIYRRVMTGNLMYVTRTGGHAWWLELSTEPFTITWKFKNASVIPVVVQPLNAEGDFGDGKMQQREFSGTQVDFSSFTISYAEPGKDTVSSFLAIEASGLIDGFVCILDVEIAGRSVLRNPFSIGGFLFTECPE